MAYDDTRGHGGICVPCICLGYKSPNPCRCKWSMLLTWWCSWILPLERWWRSIGVSGMYSDMRAIMRPKICAVAESHEWMGRWSRYGQTLWWCLRHVVLSLKGMLMYVVWTADWILVDAWGLYGADLDLWCCGHGRAGFASHWCCSAVCGTKRGLGWPTQLSPKTRSMAFSWLIPQHLPYLELLKYVKWRVLWNHSHRETVRYPRGIWVSILYWWYGRC